MSGWLRRSSRTNGTARSRTRSASMLGRQSITNTAASSSPSSRASSSSITPLPENPRFDHRAVESAPEDRGVRHAGPRRASALGDRRAVEHHRLARVMARRRLEYRPWGNSDLQRLDTVVERKVERVLVHSIGHAAHQHRRARNRPRHADSQPAPTAAGRPHVEVESADPGGGHVRHRQLVGAEPPTGANRRCVGPEPHHQSRRIPRQPPHRSRTTSRARDGRRS